jgi:hypothetical protein
MIEYPNKYTKTHTMWREKKCRSKDTKKGGSFKENHAPPSFKLNGRSLIIILNLWTLQRAEHSTMEHGEEYPFLPIFLYPVPL